MILEIGYNNQIILKIMIFFSFNHSLEMISINYCTSLRRFGRIILLFINIIAGIAASIGNNSFIYRPNYLEIPKIFPSTYSLRIKAGKRKTGPLFSNKLVNSSQFPRRKIISIDFQMLI